MVGTKENIGLSKEEVKLLSKDKLPSIIDTKDPISLKTQISQYDTGFILPEENTKESLEENRAEKQTILDKASNGVLQASGKAATSFINGTVGTIYGVGSALSNGQFSKIYDNEVTQSMDKLNDAIDKNNPLYKSKEYLDSPWYKKMMTANLWWGDILSGAGYTVGAIGTGALTGNIYRQTAKTLLKQAGKLAEAGEALTVATSSAIGEAGDEGRSGGKEWYNKQLDDLTKQYGSEQSIPQEKLQDLKTKKESLENAIFLTNLPIIAGSNFLQFGKTMTNLKSERKAIEDLGQEIAGKVEQIGNLEGFNKVNLSKGERILDKTGSILAQPVEEGTQEQTQDIIQSTTQDFYTKKFNHQDTNIVESALEGLKQAYGTNKGWESFIVGAMSTLLTGSFAKKSAIREAFKSDDPTINDALEMLNKHNPKEVYKELIQADNRAKDISKEISQAADNNDKFEFNNKQQDLLTSYTLSRLKTRQYDSLKEDLENFQKLSPEEFEKTFGVKPEESNKSSVVQLVKDRLDKVEGIAKAYETIENNFKTFSEGNKERLIHAAVVIDDSKDRRKQLKQELMKLTMKENLDLLVKFNDEIYLNNEPNKPYKKFTDTKEFKEALEKVNPIRKSEILSTVNDLDKLNKRELEYHKIFNDIVNDEEVRKENERKDKEAEEKYEEKTTKDKEDKPETNEIEQVNLDTFKEGNKVQLRGDSKDKTIESIDPETGLVYLEGDDTPHDKSEFFIPKTQKPQDKQIIFNNDITSPYTGEREDNQGVHSLGTKAKVEEILSSVEDITSYTRVRITKQVSVEGNIERENNHYLEENPKQEIVTLAPNKDIDIIYEIKDPKTGEWFDAFHGRHSDQYTNIDEKGNTKSFRFIESNKNKVNKFFKKGDKIEEFTKEDIDNLINSQEKLDTLNTIYRSIFNNKGETTISAEELKDKYGIEIFTKKGSFDIIKDFKDRPSLTTIKKANFDEKYYIFDTNNVKTSQQLWANVLGDINPKETKDLITKIKNPDNFLTKLSQRYIALGREVNGEHFLFALDTRNITSQEFKQAIDIATSKKELTKDEKNQINDELENKIYIYGSKGSHISFKVDTKDDKLSKLQLVYKQYNKNTYYDIPLNKANNLQEVIKELDKKGLTSLDINDIKIGFPKSEDTKNIKTEELAKSFNSTVTPNVFKNSKIIVDISNYIPKVKVESKIEPKKEEINPFKVGSSGVVAGEFTLKTIDSKIEELTEEFNNQTDLDKQIEISEQIEKLKQEKLAGRTTINEIDQVSNVTGTVKTKLTEKDIDDSIKHCE